jgi:hypothetical protein
MYRNDGMEGHPNVAARRRWMRALLCVVIALGVMLHLGQTAPVFADASAGQFFAADVGHSSCDAGDGLTVGHCHTISACSLYAPLEAKPAIFVRDTGHPSPLAEAGHTSWAVSPQLQPPQYSLKA